MLITMPAAPYQQPIIKLFGNFVMGFALCFSTTLNASSTAKLATGEYFPLASQQQTDYGITAAIVTAAFKAEGIKVSYDFLPWKRGYYLSRNGTYVGTFPYVKSAERELDFLYSEPIYIDQFRLFIHKRLSIKGASSFQSMCLPLGYDVSDVMSYITQKQIKIETPSNLESCFKMLAAGHVDAVHVSTLVGLGITKQLGKQSEIYPIETPLASERSYYLIISRSLPNAQVWLAQFNRGLATIRENGQYKKILENYSNPAAVSTR